jgi:hypothetical protein
MSRIPTSLLSSLFIAPMLAGCVNGSLQLPGHGPAPTAVSGPDVGALLAYYHSIKEQPERAVDRELKAQQAGLTEGRCDDSRMRLGLVLLRASELGTKHEGSGDLMRPCIVDHTLVGTDAHYLAHLIHGQLRGRAGDQARQQAALQEAQLLKKENQELRRQVEGLKAIERSLQDRRRQGAQ